MNRLKEAIGKEIKLSTRLWNKIEERSKSFKLNKGDVLVSFGSVNRFTFFLSSGSCICSQSTPSGKSRVIWFYFHDLFEFFGTPDSLFNGEPTKYELRAFDQCEVVKIHKDTIDELIETEPSFSTFFSKRILFDFITVFEARSYLITCTPSEFLAYVNEKYPQIIDRMPSKYIADFIGVTPEWYVKVKKTLKLN